MYQQKRVVAVNLNVSSDSLFKDIAVIRHEISAIVEGDFSSSQVSLITTGTRNDVRLIKRPNGRQYILKEITNPQMYSHKDITHNLNMLAKQSSSILPPLAEIYYNDRLFTLFEFAIAIRKPTLDDRIATLMSLMKATSKFEVRTSYRNIDDLARITGRNPDIFNFANVAKIKDDPEMHQALPFIVKLVDYFLHNNSFFENYHFLPLSYNHNDLKGDNMIVTKAGTKIIDWDDSGVNVRIREISRCIIGLLEDGYEPGQVVSISNNLLAKLDDNGLNLTPLEVEMFSMQVALSVIEVSSMIFHVMNSSGFKDDETNERMSRLLTNAWKFLSIYAEQDPALSAVIKDLR